MNRYPNGDISPKLPTTYVRDLGQKLGRHPTTDDVAWSLRGGKLGAWGTGSSTLAPHLR